MDDDVGPVLQRLGQIGRGECAVDHERYAFIVSDQGDPFEVEHVALRISQRLGVEGFGVGTDGGLPGVEVVGVVDEGHLDPELRQRVVEQIVGSAVQGRRGHHVPPVLRQVEEGDGLSRLAAGHSEGGHTTFE